MSTAVLRDIGTSPVDAIIARIIRTTRCIAIVGLSSNESRPSWGVARYLKSQGFRVVPVNPVYAGKTILGEIVYPNLHAIPREVGVDMVDIFRNTADAAAVIAWRCRVSQYSASSSPVTGVTATSSASGRAARRSSK